MFLPHFPFSQVDAQQVAFFLGSYAIALTPTRSSPHPNPLLWYTPHEKFVSGWPKYHPVMVDL
jgi:hypothetical protein